MVSEKTIAEAFADFHRENPHVYDALVRLARQARERGHERIGIELLFAVLRWERMMATVDPSQSAFKLNDHYTSRYARLIMERESDLKGLFAVRELRSAGPSQLYAVPEPEPETIFIVELPSTEPGLVAVVDGLVTEAGPPFGYMLGWDGPTFAAHVKAAGGTWRQDETPQQMRLA